MLNLLNLATQDTPQDEDNMSIIDINALADSPPSKFPNDSMSFDFKTPDEKLGEENTMTTI